ncbi:hypothetical protein Tco_1519479, partial [Tanacetum coccineum]
MAATTIQVPTNGPKKRNGDCRQRSIMSNVEGKQNLLVSIVMPCAVHGV